MKYENRTIPPPPGQRITELHVWIATHPDGGEGIISADLPMFSGTRHAPLLSSKRHVVEKMEPIARKCAGKDMTVRLATFRLIDP